MLRLLDDAREWSLAGRYLYLWNNPLNGTDPMGYWGVKERQWLGTIVAIVGAAFGQYYMVGWTGPQIAAYHAIVGGVSGGITTGNWNGALQGAFASTITAGVGGAGMALPQHALANAYVGGAVSAMQGGKFGFGFVSAGLGRLAGPAINANVSSPGGQIVAHALVGGSLSAVTGGKFANGAVTGEMSWAMSAAADGLSREETEETNETTKAFVPREGDTATGRYGLFPEYAGDPVYEEVYDLAVIGNRRSSNNREHHAYGGMDAEGNLVFQPLRHGRQARVSEDLLKRMAGEFYTASPGGTVQYSFHTHGDDVGRLGAFENFSPEDRSFYRQNRIVGRVTGFASTPRGLLLMYNLASGDTVQFGRVPAVPRRPGR